MREFATQMDETRLLDKIRLAVDASPIPQFSHEQVLASAHVARERACSEWQRLTDSTTSAFNELELPASVRRGVYRVLELLRGIVPHSPDPEDLSSVELLVGMIELTLVDAYKRNSDGRSAEQLRRLDRVRQTLDAMLLPLYTYVELQFGINMPSHADSFLLRILENWQNEDDISIRRMHRADEVASQNVDPDTDRELVRSVLLPISERQR